MFHPWILLYLSTVLGTAQAFISAFPPSIVKSPIAHRIYRVDDEVILDCVAEGPNINYEWKKNGHTLNMNVDNIYRPSVDGTIHITSATTMDEGYYQCEAHNQWGVSMSNISYLQRAVLGSFQVTRTAEWTAEEGMPFTLQCNTPKCVPRPIFSWALAKDIVDEGPASMKPDRRIQIDEQGNLRFSYITMEDSQQGRLYKCNVFNPHLDNTVGGSYAKITVTPKGGVKSFAPVISFVSQSPSVAIEGRNITLRCFFSGSPEPNLVWFKVGGSMPLGRHSITNYHTELTIRDVQRSDQGDYTCRGTNTAKASDHTIQIEVKAVPVFQSPSNRPFHRNATEKESTTFVCKTYAVPPATVKWYMNGILLESNKLPPRVSLSDGGNQLVISDLCKSCTDREKGTDLGVIQCNASNTVGSAYAEGYLNVLSQTLIVDPPKNVFVDESTTDVTFPCQVVADPLTPATVTWYKVSSDGKRSLVYEIPPRVRLLPDGSLAFHVAIEDSVKWMELRGEYQCEASNGYHLAHADVKLEYELPPDVTTAAAPILAASSMIGDLWWIFIIIAVVLLLLILLLCCCICIQRNKGDTYPVGDKEVKAGNDPEKELDDTGFRDYQRHDAAPLKGSRGSLSSSLKSDSEDDEDLNQYGDFDNGKFTEDGSFIGEYMTDNSRRRPRGDESNV